MEIFYLFLLDYQLLMFSKNHSKSVQKSSKTLKFTDFFFLCGQTWPVCLILTDGDFNSGEGENASPFIFDWISAQLAEFWSRSIACGICPATASKHSRAPLELPGRLMISVVPRIPATDLV